jgi:glutathione S-transferase
MIGWMAEDLKNGPYLAGHAFSNADVAVIPYILRLELLKLGAMFTQYPAVADWWARVRERPSVKQTIFDRMSDTDWAPFRNLSPDPWPAVQAILKAA